MESDNAAAATASSSTGVLVDNDSTFASPKGFRRPFNVVTRSFLKYRLRVCDKTFLSQKLGNSHTRGILGIRRDAESRIRYT